MLIFGSDEFRAENYKWSKFNRDDISFSIPHHKAAAAPYLGRPHYCEKEVWTALNSFVGKSQHGFWAQSGWAVPMTVWHCDRGTEVVTSSSWVSESTSLTPPATCHMTVASKNTAISQVIPKLCPTNQSDWHKRHQVL